MDQTRETLQSYSEAQTRVQQKYLERMKRTYRILQGFDAFLADEVFNQRREHTRQKTRRPEEAAAVVIQKRYRGYRARKQYGELLYAKYEAEEERAKQAELRRVEEGLLVMESLQLQQQIKEKQLLSRQKDLQRNFAATVIQRCYRQWKEFPLPASALTLMSSDSDSLPDLPICPAPHSSWAPPSQAQMKLDGLEENSEEDSESDGEPEVFARMHHVSRDSQLDYEDQLMSSDRGDVEGGLEGSLTASSGRSLGLKSLNTTGDFSMTQYMRKSEPVWGGPQSLSTLRTELTGTAARPRLPTLEELRKLPVSVLRRKAESAHQEIIQLSENLAEITEKRDKMLANVDFSKRLVSFLATLIDT